MISREGSGVLKLMERRKEMQLLVVEGLLKNSRNKRRNGHESTRAGRKKPERQETQRSSSGGRSRRQEQHNGDGDEKTGFVSHCAVRRRSRSRRPDVWDRRQWCVRFPKWPGTERRTPVLCFGMRWRQSLPLSGSRIVKLNTSIPNTSTSSSPCPSAFVGALIAMFPVTAESGSPAQFDGSMALMTRRCVVDRESARCSR
jgi:hypothetical protein